MQLENMKREFIKENSLNQKGQPLKKASDIPTGVTGVPPSDQKLVSEMASLATPGPSTAPPGPKPGPSTAGSAIDQFLELEATCNNEVLNLKVAKPLLSFSKRKFSESEEEEDEDDEINVIDMNMLINMNCSRKE
ncbi:uncharacterized protein LOC135082622 [Ostrinia nubilalis]|uniref:uncharacterized protein LOC135082622 n=1 Tax=Ostrinia nubilalis TaxID=29057 RepID=UPI0030825916